MLLIVRDVTIDEHWQEFIFWFPVIWYLYFRKGDKEAEHHEYWDSKRTY